MWSNVGLVLAGAAGSALAGIVASSFGDRMAHRAFRRARLAEWIDRDRAVLAEYLLAVDDFTAALIEEADDLLVPPVGESFDANLHRSVARARREHERLWHQISLVVPDGVSDELSNLRDAVATFNEWAHSGTGEFTEAERNRLNDAIDDAMDHLVNAARIVYSDAEEAGRLA